MRQRKNIKALECVWIKGQNNEIHFGCCSQTQFHKTISLVIAIDKINFISEHPLDEVTTSSIYMRLKILAYALQKTWH